MCPLRADQVTGSVTCSALGTGATRCCVLAQACIHGTALLQSWFGIGCGPTATGPTVALGATTCEMDEPTETVTGERGKPTSTPTNAAAPATARKTETVSKRRTFPARLARANHGSSMRSLPSPIFLRQNALSQITNRQFHASDVSSTSSVPDSAEAEALAGSNKSPSGRNQWSRSAVTAATTVDNTCHAWTVEISVQQHRPRRTVLDDVPLLRSRRSARVRSCRRRVAAALFGSSRSGPTWQCGSRGTAVVRNRSPRSPAVAVERVTLGIGTAGVSVSVKWGASRMVGGWLAPPDWARAAGIQY